MKILHISVQDKIAIYQKRDGDIVGGNSDYQVKFTFDDEWDAHTEKTARFIVNGQFTDVEFTGDTCQVPIITSADSVSVGVYAGDLCTTTPATIPAKRSILCESASPSVENDEYYGNKAKEAAELAVEAVERATEEALGAIEDKMDITQPKTEDLMVNVYGNNYVSATGSINDSGSWTSYIILDTYEKIIFAGYTNDTSLHLIGFFSSTTPSRDTFISGLTPEAYDPSNYYKFTVTPDIIPEGTKSIVACSRTATGPDTMLTGTTSVVVNIARLEEKVDALVLESRGRGNVKAIFCNIPNANDFTVIKDEIWFAENKYENGVATVYTTVHRYKIEEGHLIHLSDIDTDFGHWNCVDYNEENDCLVFSNAANAVTTEGNFFSVVKNPLALGSVARLETCGIKYPVDVGFKVQAVWGDSNWGKNNIVYLLSNYASTVTKVMLLKDASGEFNGEYLVLETKELPGVNIGIGGADFWGDTIYIGDGTKYGLIKMSMTDYSTEAIAKRYYRDNGTEITGSTQGVHVDNNHIWVFSNVAGLTENYLVQYYR